jgi:hypothetical protein
LTTIVTLTPPPPLCGSENTVTSLNRPLEIRRALISSIMSRFQSSPTSMRAINATVSSAVLVFSST